MTSVLRESLKQTIIPWVLLFVSKGSWVQLYLCSCIYLSSYCHQNKKNVSVRQMISADNNMGSSRISGKWCFDDLAFRSETMILSMLVSLNKRGSSLWICRSLVIFYFFYFFLTNIKLNIKKHSCIKGEQQFEYYVQF